MVLLALLLVSCAPARATELPTVSKQGFSISFSDDATKPVTFVFDGQPYRNVDELLTAARHTFSGDLEKIAAAPSKYGSIRIIRPTDETMAPLAARAPNREAAQGANSFYSLLDDMRIQAVERSNMFSEISVEKLDVAVPEIGRFDYVFWKDGMSWYLAGKSSPGRHRVMPYTNGWMVGFVASLSRALVEERDQKNANSMRTLFVGRSTIFEFRGNEYLSVSALTEAMSLYFFGQANSVAPTTKRLCGKGRVVIASQRQATIPPVPNAGQQDMATAEAGRRAYLLVMSTAKALALKQAAIFETLRFDVMDVQDVPTDDYDWVLWQPASGFGWRFRVGAGDAYKLAKLPTDPQEWVDSVYSQLSEKKAPLPCGVRQ